MAETSLAPHGKPRWYASPWAMLAAGYVFAPLGLYLMWRYRRWPRWVKALLTVVGSALALIATYVSLRFM